jgi:hypothetical protein
MAATNEGNKDLREFLLKDDLNSVMVQSVNDLITKTDEIDFSEVSAESFNNLVIFGKQIDSEVFTKVLIKIIKGNVMQKVEKEDISKYFGTFSFAC